MKAQDDEIMNEYSIDDYDANESSDTDEYIYDGLELEDKIRTYNIQVIILFKRNQIFQQDIKIIHIPSWFNKSIKEIAPNQVKYIKKERLQHFKLYPLEFIKNLKSGSEFLNHFTEQDIIESINNLKEEEQESIDSSDKVDTHKLNPDKWEDFGVVAKLLDIQTLDIQVNVASSLNPLSSNHSNYHHQHQIQHQLQHQITSITIETIAAHESILDTLQIQSVNGISEKENETKSQQATLENEITL
ncbi:hypothetical protein DDB_G0272046 [Dictyostelium discoideum AX4]|uniref:Uncharacterized protein n=1 Tax=Dictyostelium discoideum TaxID=44689 RepID=Q55A75_DICDI|nr:hypothetical protein DDB_G0272046 [Dictyostelium discoideum AX4]EAL71457.1 hypothetical protein DDB_G0272046 [Dictyostelium discoideum AX4]|eukprot:XP_645391.1 hypothetical protein DDB_G0272046 [Dictyostelium discoideum AX4]